LAGVSRALVQSSRNHAPLPRIVSAEVLTADRVAANRAPEKKLYVVPSLDLVATRLGKLPGPAVQPTFPNECWKRRMAPAPRPPENRSEASSEQRNTR